MKFEEKIINSSKYTGYASHFQAVFVGADLAKSICLVVSCILSTRFFETVFIQYIGEYAIYGAVMLSILIAGFVGFLTDRLAVYYLRFQTVESWTLFLLAVAIIGGVACDFKGGEQIGIDKVGSAPVDSLSQTLSSSYDTKIASINTQIEAIKEANFYWCGKHRKAHKCESANFYIDPTRDKKAVAKIETLEVLRDESQQTANKLLLTTASNFSADRLSHENEVAKSKARMQYVSIIATAIFLMLSFWQFKFRERVQSEAKERGEREIKEAREVIDTRLIERNSDLDRREIDDLKTKLDQHLADLMAESSDVLDEKLAQIEHERESKKEPR